MGDGLHFRVAGPDHGPVEALALARRIVADSGLPPVEPALTWLSTRPEAFAGLAGELGAARVDLTFEPADPGPFLVALAAEEPDLLQAGGSAPGPRFGLSGQRGDRDLELTLWNPGPAGWSDRLVAAHRAGLLTDDDVRRAAEPAGDRPVRFALPRAALDRAGALWDPGSRVEVVAGFDLRTPAAVRAARLGAVLIEVSVGWQDEGPAAEPLIDAVVAGVGGDRLAVVWDCGFAGAVAGYTGVVLCANATPALEPAPGGHDVHIMIDRRSADPAGLAARIAARSAATVADGRYW